MAKLNTLFEKFLSDINPDEKAVEYAAEAHQRVRKALEVDEKFKEYVENSFLYGSYKRHTAVGDIKDVDIVVLTNFDPTNEEHSPNRVLRKLKDALARCYDDPDFLEYQRRSIRVDDPLPDVEDAELTLDVIPAVAVNGEEAPLLVPDREQKEWIKSHPKGHLRHTTELNDKNYSEERYVPLVKMMKWWWKNQCELRQPDVERPKPKGFWVECLTGENFDPTQRDWADHFIAVLGSVADKYAQVKSVPKLSDPGLPGEVVKTSMTKDEFEVFMTTVNECLEQAQAAREEENKLKSSELWREIFGDKFSLYDEEETEETKDAASKVPLGPYDHAKQLPWPINLRGKVRIDAYLYYQGKKFGGLNSDKRVIRNDLNIKYVASTNVRGEYEVYWQVVNTGPYAKKADGLRGEFFKAKLLGGDESPDPLINWERSEYTGKHWIECFIVKNGQCVARSGRFYVSIKNPQFP